MIFGDFTLKRSITTRPGLWLLLLLMTAGCATQATREGDIANPGAVVPVKILDVATIPGDQGTGVRIVCSAPFEYTVYRLSEPSRVAIEISNVSVGSLIPSTEKGEGLVNNVTLVPFTESGSLRVEISIDNSVNYELVESGASLLVTLLPEKGEEAKQLEKARRQIVKLRNRLETAEQEREKDKKEIRAETRSRDRSVVEDEIWKTVQGWLDAWRNKDIGKYESYYASVFTHKTMDRADWIKSKKRKFSHAGEIAIDISLLMIAPGNGLARVEFLQRYQAGNLHDTGVKTLTLIKTESGWKIDSEVWRKMEDD